MKAFGNYDGPILIIAGVVMVSAGRFWRIDATKPLIAETVPAKPTLP